MHPFKLAIALGAALPLALPTAARAQNGATIVATSIPNVSQLEYRSVTLQPSARWPQFGQNKPVSAHLWVVPARDGEPALGFGWNGVPYELQSVGEKADWRADVEAFLQSNSYFSLNPFGFDKRPVARQLLMQLNATDLMRKIGDRFKSGSDGNPQWDYFRNLRDAGVESFTAGQFSQAQLQLRQLLELWPSKKPTGRDDLSLEARRVLADIERRAQQQPRPTDEIAGLIWDLQNVRAYQQYTPGDISWTQNATIQKLVNAGDGAVEPLLDALETDDRLTLSARDGGGFRWSPGSIGTARDAARSALQVLLKHRYEQTNYNLTPAQRDAEVVAQMRADWNKVKGQTPVERVFDDLAQSGQTAERLSEAARELVRVGAPYGYRQISPKLPGQTFFGEPLRARQNPSVSDVLEARIQELTSRALDADRNASPNAYVLARALRTANELALVYAQWDAPRAWLLLGAQLEKTKTFAAQTGPLGADDAQRSLNSTRREFLAARLNSPYRAEALREYGAFLQSQPFGFVAKENYRPLWRYADEPAMMEAAHALFDAPRKPFETAATRVTDGSNYDSAFRLLSSPLVKTPVFRDAVLRELKNQTVIGTLTKAKDDEAAMKVTAWKWNGQSVKLNGRTLENGIVQPLRVCDLVGFWLYEKLPDEDGRPRRGSLLDVALPTAQRDARLEQIAVLVRQGRVVAEEFGIAGIDFD